MTLQIWRRPSKNNWPNEPEISISAPSAVMVIMAIITFSCFDTKRYVWKVR